MCPGLASPQAQPQTRAQQGIWETIPGAEMRGQGNETGRGEHSQKGLLGPILPADWMENAVNPHRRI